MLSLRFLLACVAIMPVFSALAPVGAIAETNAALTEEDAKAFVAEAEDALAASSELAERTRWVARTSITVDTGWLEAKTGAVFATLQATKAKQAAAFDNVTVDPVTRRKLELLKRNLVLAPPDRPGASQELSELSVRLKTLYATGTVEYDGQELTLDEIEEVMRTSRDPAELKALWEGWHGITPPMRQDYARLVGLANEGAQDIGYANTGVLWRSWYDMPSDKFATTLERVLSQLAPFCETLHCYARKCLNEHYGDAVQSRTGPIRADLLGNMWAQSWLNIYDLLAPQDMSLGYDLTTVLEDKGYDAEKIVKTSEGFYTSLGFPPLPDTFWQRSMFTRPPDRKVNCSAYASHVDYKEDVRISACFRPTEDDFGVAHHELGHNYYDLAYKDQPYLFKTGANDGFHEAIGDFIQLYSVAPDYLKEIGLVETSPGGNTDIPYLLLMALNKVAFLPFGYSVDKWRWRVFSGEITSDTYTTDWWDIRRRYQGVEPPVPRPADVFDPGAKFHIVASVPYARYFLATIYQFQFYRAACEQIGWTGPLNRCSIYGNGQVGDKLQEMLRLGASKPWPDALEAFTGERELNADAILAYFAPLQDWLTEQTEGEACGW